MIPERPTGQARYWAFRGQTRGGLTAAWSTSAVDALGAALDPVMLEPPQGYEIGPTTVLGAEPPRTSTSITLADPDGRIMSMLLPDRTGRASLTGRLYLGEIRDGQITETPVTPTLTVAGSPTSDGYAVTVPLEADVSAVLGRSVAIWTVADLLGATLLDVRDADPRLRAYLDGASPGVLWERMRVMATENLGSIVPWAYGPAVAPLIPLTSSYPRWWISVVASTAVPTWERGGAMLVERDGVLAPDPGGMLSRTMVDPASPAGFTVELEIEDAMGLSRTIRLLCYCMPEPPEGSSEGTYYERLRPLPAERTPSTPASMMGGWGSPAATLLALIADHSERGIVGLHQASWERVIRATDPVYADTTAGLFGSEGATIAEVVQHLAPVCGLRLWLGQDDVVHASVAGYTMQDAQAARGDLLELQEMDIYPGGEGGGPVWTTTMVGDPDDDGAGVSRVSIEWSDLQRRIWPLETSASLPALRGVAPEGRERILSGAWLRGDRGRDLAVAVQSSVTGDTVRVELATHLSLARASPTELIRVTHPIGVGIPGQGWESRLARIDSLSVLPGEDAVRLLLTDLGLAERMRLGLLDAWERWALYIPGPGESLELHISGGEMHIEGVVAAYPEWDETSMTVWMPGAPDPRLRGSWRAERMVGDTIIVVLDHDPGPGQMTVNPLLSDPIVGAGWAVMRTDLLDPTYREQYIRAADLIEEAMESGAEAFRYSAL